MRLLKQFLAVAVVVFAGSLATAAVEGNPWLTLAFGVATGVAAIAVYAWVVRRTEHRAPAEVARAGAAGRLAAGRLLGFAMVAAVIANYVSRILTKLDLRDRVQAVVYAYRRGLVT